MLEEVGLHRLASWMEGEYEKSRQKGRSSEGFDQKVFK